MIGGVLVTWLFTKKDEEENVLLRRFSKLFFYLIKFNLLENTVKSFSNLSQYEALK